MVQARSKNKGGRPLFDGKDPKDVLPKLEAAALIDAPVEEMCYYADISSSAYYRYLESHPKFREKITALRERLSLRSRQNIAQQIENGDISLSKWMLERKKPNEFAEKLKVEYSGEIGDGIHQEDEQLRQEFKAKLKQNIQRRWQARETTHEDIKRKTSDL